MLLDNALYGYGNAFQLFCNNSGVDTLVSRIAVRMNLSSFYGIIYLSLSPQHEIDLDIKEFSPPEGGIHSQAAYGKYLAAILIFDRYSLSPYRWFDAFSFIRVKASASIYATHDAGFWDFGGAPNIDRL